MRDFAILFVLVFCALTMSFTAKGAAAPLVTFTDLTLVPERYDAPQPLILDRGARRQIRRYLSLQARQKTIPRSGKAARQLTDEMRRLRIALTAQGHDVDRLMIQWVSGRLLQQPAHSDPNLALDGKTLSIVGYIIPAGRDETGTFVSYLVQSRGMCGHTPAPPSDQVIRIVSPHAMESMKLYDYVTVTGVLRLRPRSERMFVVDGDVAFKSDWMLQTPMGPQNITPPRGRGTGWKERVDHSPFPRPKPYALHTNAARPDISFQSSSFP